MNQPAIERREVYYSGQVQGIGFRYTARQIAGKYEVTGFVRNLADGRVQLVLEGPTDQLDGTLRDVAESMDPYIRHTDVQPAPATGEFVRFEIAF